MKQRGFVYFFFQYSFKKKLKRVVVDAASCNVFTRDEIRKIYLPLCCCRFFFNTHGRVFILSALNQYNY